jgi:hypothetical protein
VRNRQVEKSPEMNDFQLQSDSRIRSRRRSLGGVSSLLQGGVALSADHGGDEALGEANFHPYWIVAPVEQVK